MRTCGHVGEQNECGFHQISTTSHNSLNWHISFTICLSFSLIRVNALLGEEPERSIFASSNKLQWQQFWFGCPLDHPLSIISLKKAIYNAHIRCLVLKTDDISQQSTAFVWNTTPNPLAPPINAKVTNSKQNFVDFNRIAHSVILAAKF